MRHKVRSITTSLVIYAIFSTCLALVPVILSTQSASADLLDTLRFSRNKVASIYDSQGRDPLDCLKSSGTCGGTKTATNELTLPAGGYFAVFRYPNPTYRVGLSVCDGASSCTNYADGNIYAYKPGEYFLLKIRRNFPEKSWLLVFSLGSANPYLLSNGSSISWTFNSANVGEGAYFSNPGSLQVSIAGTLRAGSTLTGSETFTGVDVEVTRQWKLSDYYRPLYNVGGADITGATGSTYTLTNADVGKYIRYNVKLRNMQGSDSLYGVGSDYALVLPALGAALTPTFGTYTPTADGFTVAITNYSTSYTWAGTATNGGSVSFSGSNGNGLATITGVAPNTASVATITTTRTDYNSGSAQTSSTTSLLAGLTPTFGTYTRTATGFTVGISNYDTAYTWQGTATSSGSVAFSGTTNNGVATITGVAPNTASVATITTARAGYANASANSNSTTSLGAALNPTFTSYTQTSSGYTAQISNYSNQYNWSGTATNGASVSISNTGLVTVSGLSAGQASVATISTSRSGYVNGSATTVSTSALSLALTPVFGAYTPTADGFTVAISNYDPAFTWSGTATRGGTVTFSGSLNNGLATISEVSANTASAATITTTRTGYNSGTATTTSTSSLNSALNPAFGTYTRTENGFTVAITNYSSSYTWAGSATNGGTVSISGSGIATITGLAPGATSVATITTTRSGYSNGTSNTASTAALNVALTPTFGTYTQTSSGFTVQITNYNSSYTWGKSATNGASVSISGSGLVTVSGLSGGESSVATITTTRTGYVSGTAETQSTAALQPALTPIFGEYTPTADGFKVVITNYDSAYTWSGTATKNGSVAFSGVDGNGLATIEGVAANTASVATITTSRSGYSNGSAATTSTTSLRTGMVSTTGAATPIFGGFTFTITNYNAAYNYELTATAGTATAGTANGSNLPVTVSGLTNGQDATVAINTIRNGYAPAKSTKTGRAKTSDLTPTTGNPGTWTASAISDDGQYVLFAGNNSKLFVSPDNGENWAAVSSVKAWTSVAISGNGSKMIAAGSKTKIYYSTDFGSTWSSKGATRNWRALAINGDGSKLFAAAQNGFIYRSTNGGSSWTELGLSKNWRAIASSQNGNILVAAAFGGNLYTSVDGGNTWTARELERNWSAVSISDDGSAMVASVGNGSIYVSNDTGATWNQINGVQRKNWNSLSCDSTCRNVAMTNVSGDFFIATLAGPVMAGITNPNRPSKWSTVTLNSSGTQVIAGSSSGMIYRGTETFVTWSQRTRIQE